MNKLSIADLKSIRDYCLYKYDITKDSKWADIGRMVINELEKRIIELEQVNKTKHANIKK